MPHKIIKLFFIVLACLIFWPSVTRAATISKPSNYLSLNYSLVSHWTFDGQHMSPFIDDSASNIIGFLRNYVSTTTVAGKLGQALDFDGVDDWVALSYNQLSGSFNRNSICSWVKIKQNGMGTGGTNQTIYKIGDSAATFVRVGSATVGDYGGSVLGGFYVSYWNSSVEYSRASTAAVFVNNSWTHVCYTFDGTALKLYANGLPLDMQTPPADTYGDGEVGFSVGATSQSGGNWNGTIDDIRTYHRVLTAQEIKQLYKVGTSKISLSPRLPAGSSLKNGLVGHWTFDGKDMYSNVADLSGNNNTGYLLGQTDIGTTTVPGRSGQALNFDGVDDYVTTGGPASLTFAAGAPYTFSHWIKCDTISGSYVFYAGPSLNQRAFYIREDNNSFFGFREYNATYHDFTSSSVCLGEWTYLTWVTDNANNMTLYVNGANPITIAMTSTETQFKTLGKGYESTNDFSFDGALDDVRVYNRSLSAGEVRQLYYLGEAAKAAASPRLTVASTSCSIGIDCGLVGYWTFDGKDLNWGTGVAADRSGSGNNGQLLGLSTTTSVVRGKFGQALQFTGSGSAHISIPNSSTLNPSSLTVSAWVKPNSFASAMTIISKNRIAAPWSDPYTSFMVRINGATGIEPGMSTVSYNAGTVTPLDPVLVEGEWYHIVMTFNAATLARKIYVNNKEYVAANFTAPTYTSQPLTIGADYGSAPVNDQFNGAIDDVRLYNRALSAQEIGQLYGMGR